MRSKIYKQTNTETENMKKRNVFIGKRNQLVIEFPEVWVLEVMD